MSLTWLLCNLQLWRHGSWFRKFTIRFRPIRKEIASSMYTNEPYSYGLAKRVPKSQYFQKLVSLFSLFQNFYETEHLLLKWRIILSGNATSSPQQMQLARHVTGTRFPCITWHQTWWAWSFLQVHITWPASIKILFIRKSVLFWLLRSLLPYW